jgi:glycosyltransferase involved in cell wall biosynthesis
VTTTSLLVTPAAPWGEAAGFRMRLEMVLEGLARLGRVDVCVVHQQRPVELDAPPPAPVGGAAWARVHGVPGWRWRVLASNVTPVRMARLEPSDVPSLLRTSHALTWCVEPRGFEPVRHLVPGPVVLDLQNLHDWSAHHQRRSPHQAWLQRSVVLPRLEARWREWQREAAAAVGAVVVCSELDAARLGAPNAVVVPNCYRPVEVTAAVPSPTSDRLTATFVGTMQYEPNRTAARFFAREVLPRVREHVPGATFDVVGAFAHLVADLRGRPGVRVLGHVADLPSVLGATDVVVAPLFAGGGTRLKVIEAFAHHLPVVATTVGAEGLAVRHDRHLLLADDSRAFADAVLRLHRSSELRARLVANAFTLYQDRYTWAHGVNAVEQVVRGMVRTADDAR